jgi:hypothetical protein
VISRTVSVVLVLFLRFRDLLFEFHVTELVGVENLAALHAFNILYVFLAGDDTDSWVFAGDRHLGFVDRSIQEAFAPDCIEPWLFVQEGFDKDLLDCLNSTAKITLQALKTPLRISFAPIEIATESVVYSIKT